jgi:cobalt-zinc-cadmium efflux system membrane fusion protein
MENNSLPKRATIIVLVTALASLAACSKKSSDDPPAPASNAASVTLTPAQRQNIKLFTVAESKFHKTIDTTGSVDFDNDQATSVLAPFSGPVTRIVVQLGQEVKKGDALAVVDSPDFATAVGAYRKAIATAKTARQVADTDKDLLTHNGVSQRDAQQAQTDAANAEADREAARQGLVSLNVDPKIIKDIEDGHAVTRIDGTIRSPIAGTVVEKLISPGQLLQAGTTPCFTVADLSKVWVTAQVFGSTLSSIRVGDTSDVQTDFAAKALSGKVDNIAALVDPNTRAVGVRVVVDNPNGLLKKQMYVRVLIHSSQESSGLLVPVSAVLRDDENLPFVYVTQANGNFARAHVTLGYRDDERYEITEGLHAGDQIIVDGALFVQFMQSQ